MIKIIKDEINYGMFNILDYEGEVLEDVKKFTGDFETSTWEEDSSRVWAFALCDIDNEEIKIGTNIDDFIEILLKENNPVVYFHNLKFDGEFLINWAFRHNFKHVETKEDIDAMTFTTLISDLGQFYSIVFYFKKGNKKVKKITFYDSLKIIPFSVAEIAKAFNLEISKLEIDYNKPREIGYNLDEIEKEYIKNDVLIVAKALKVLFNEGLDKMTEGANALNDFKNILTKSKFNHYFPSLEYNVDKDLRKAYKGGFTYLSPEYKEKTIKNGVVLDVNSLYPSVMYEKLLPFGDPYFFEGKYKDDIVYPLYIQMITCSFELKKNKIPTIQIKNNKSFFRSNEYLTSSKNEIVCLTLTNIDLKLFLENYNVYELNYVCGWKFKGIHNIFKNYIDKWITRKNNATIEGNKGQRTLAKLMLNSLYGKFATSLDFQSKIPFLGDDEIVHYRLSEKQEKKGIYLPIGIFITSYAREKTIRTSQAIMDYSINKYGKNLYVYSDTDSIHCLLTIEELKQFCEIDDVKLGAWKHEGSFTKAKFVRQKCYLEEINGNLEITCAGMPKTCYEFVKWNDFKTGFSCGGKLTFKHVIGGVKLVETEFTIKDI